jgi:hypothetical protein
MFNNILRQSSEAKTDGERTRETELGAIRSRRERGERVTQEREREERQTERVGGSKVEELCTHPKP